MQPQILPPIHPGEILSEEFLQPLALTQTQLAQAIHVPVGRISEIVNGRRAITGDTALRLAQFFNTSAKLWMGLQMDYDLRLAQQKSGVEIQQAIQPMEQAS